MPRLLLATLIASYCATAVAEEADAPASVLNQFDRTLAKEPIYESTPKYSLIVLGPKANVRVWMVEANKGLYVDKNANGDLTDDGPPIQPSDVRNLDSDRWDFNYLLDAITPADGSRHTQFDLRCWNYGGEEDSYGLSLSVDGKFPMYAGWFGTFWSAKPETASVIHFGGPLTPTMLRSKEFTIGSGRRRLSMAFINPGSGEGAQSRLSIDALAPELVPRLNIEWPSTGGGLPQQTSHDLIERCCYWEFYTTEFQVPDNIGVGAAKVHIEFPDGAVPFELTTTEIEVPVVAQSREGED